MNTLTPEQEKRLNGSMNDVIRATKRYITSEVSKESRDIVYQVHGAIIADEIALAVKQERERIKRKLDEPTTELKKVTKAQIEWFMKVCGPWSKK